MRHNRTNEWEKNVFSIQCISNCIIKELFILRRNRIYHSNGNKNLHLDTKILLDHTVIIRVHTFIGIFLQKIKLQWLVSYKFIENAIPWLAGPNSFLVLLFVRSILYN